VPGSQPLLGWEEACRDLHRVCLVEGPADLLALRLWDVPGLALCGTRLTAQTMALLGHWAQLYAVLDADAAGLDATNRLVQTLGPRVIPVTLPSGIKDPADLAPHPDGEALFRAAIRVATDEHRTRCTQP
jgi:DNA primase